MIRAGFHTTGQGLGEHERGGGLEFAAEQIGGAGRLEPQGPPVLATVWTSVSSTSHRGSWPSPGARATICPLASENRLMRRLLRTGLQPAASPLSGRSGLKGKDHFCQDSMRPRARPATSRIPGLPR